MDRFDRDILEFVRSWAPYGGPPSDEVLAEFGLTPSQFAERVDLIISAENARRDRERRQPWLRVGNSAPRSTAPSANALE